MKNKKSLFLLFSIVSIGFFGCKPKNSQTSHFDGKVELNTKASTIDIPLGDSINLYLTTSMNGVALHPQSASTIDTESGITTNYFIEAKLSSNEDNLFTLDTITVQGDSNLSIQASSSIEFITINHIGDAIDQTATLILTLYKQTITRDNIKKLEQVSSPLEVTLSAVATPDTYDTKLIGILFDKSPQIDLSSKFKDVIISVTTAKGNGTNTPSDLNNLIITVEKIMLENTDSRHLFTTSSAAQDLTITAKEAPAGIYSVTVKIEDSFRQLTGQETFILKVIDGEA